MNLEKIKCFFGFHDIMKGKVFIHDIEVYQNTSYWTNGEDWIPTKYKKVQTDIQVKECYCANQGCNKKWYSLKGWFGSAFGLLDGMVRTDEFSKAELNYAIKKL